MTRYASLWALPLLAGALPAFASELPTSWQSVGDDVLAQANGKFLNQNMISGFQLVMTSQWQTPSGASLYAQGAVQVQSAGGSYQATTSSLSGVTPALNNVMAPAGATVQAALSSVNGVMQLTQVAGNGNAATNVATIAFLPAGQWVPMAGGNAGPSNSSSLLNGMSANVAVNAAGVQLNLVSPFGNVSQSIAGGAGSPMSQIMQMVQVKGNSQQVLNTLNLNLQTLSITANALRQIGLQSALANMVGLRR